MFVQYDQQLHLLEKQSSRGSANAFRVDSLGAKRMRSKTVSWTIGVIFGLLNDFFPRPLAVG
jgi:hypothetical protein